jgi:chromosome segregation ATPase
MSDGFSQAEAIPTEGAPGVDATGGFADQAPADTQGTDQRTYTAEQWTRMQATLQRQATEAQKRAQAAEQRAQELDQKHRQAEAESQYKQQLLDAGYTREQVEAAIRDAREQIQKEIEERTALEKDASETRTRREREQRAQALKDELADACDEYDVTDEEWTALRLRVDYTLSPFEAAKQFRKEVKAYRKQQDAQGQHAGALTQRSNTPLPRGGQSGTVGAPGLKDLLTLPDEEFRKLRNEAAGRVGA